jgi:hypothetical protein
MWVHSGGPDSPVKLLRSGDMAGLQNPMYEPFSAWLARTCSWDFCCPTAQLFNRGGSNL